MACCYWSCANAVMGQCTLGSPRTSPTYQPGGCGTLWGYSLATLQIDSLIVSLLLWAWSSVQAEKPAWKVGHITRRWASTVLQAEVAKPLSIANLARLKVARECLHKLQTHPRLKGRQTLRFNTGEPQYPWVRFSTTLHRGLAWRRDSTVNCVLQQDRCQHQADENHRHLGLSFWVMNTPLHCSVFERLYPSLAKGTAALSPFSSSYF